MTLFKFEDKAPLLSPSSWVAPSADIMGDVTINENASVWFGAVLRGDCEKIVVGRGANVQDGAVVHTDPGFPALIGDGVTVGHLVMLHGCEIGSNSLIGIGAVILNGASIGKNCIIGSKALVPEGKVIPDNSLVIGIPGKVVKQVSDAQVTGNEASALHYIQNSHRFKSGLHSL